MEGFKNGLKYEDLTINDQNENYSLFSPRKNDSDFPNLTLNTSGGDNFFNNEENNFLNNKREKESKKRIRKPHNKYTFDNLKRESKHLVIENVMTFINKKIFEAYNGNIGYGITKKELVKLNQKQKRNSSAEFNKAFIYKTLKEIFSEKVTKRIKLLGEDHNKELIEKLLEEKKEQFEKLFNVTFIECVEHFVGNKEINELKGLTLFKELKEKIMNKHKEDRENYYDNLEIFMKEYEKRINNTTPHKKKLNYN